MSLADLFSGGADSEAAGTLEAALQNLSNVNTPTVQQLTLPQLQSYVQAGLITPQQAQADLVGKNAFDTTTADNAGLDTELSTIGQLQDIINKGGNDAEAQQQIQFVLNTLGTTEAGNNAAILRDAQARGVGNSGTALAARLAANQNDASNANANALAAAAAAEQRQLGAISSAGQLGGQVQGQEYTQAANKANAANAIAQFNAQQQQDINKMNTSNANAAQAANVENAQNIANKNTETAQMQEESGVQAQQQAFQDALEKAGAWTSGSENLSNQQMQVGQQNAGELGGIISTVGNLYTGGAFGNPYGNVSTNMSSTGQPDTPPPTNQVASGGRIREDGDIQRPRMNFKLGGPVPGEDMVPGDSTKNDNVPANLSPNEIVLPVTVSKPAMNGDFSKAIQFLKSLQRPPAPAGRTAVHPRAVLDTLRALNAHHMGAA